MDHMVKRMLKIMQAQLNNTGLLYSLVGCGNVGSDGGGGRWRCSSGGTGVSYHRERFPVMYAICPWTAKVNNLF
jgi:hypothetical protein